MPYNPFKKPLKQILYGTFNLAGLQELISNKVEEGYFVEYKQQLPSRKAISKSIAALANTYGEWFFVGEGIRPFFDSNKYYEYIAEFGIPVIHSNHINIPADKKGVEIDLGNPEEHIPWVTLAGLLTMALGMPSPLLADSLLSLNERQEDGR